MRYLPLSYVCLFLCCSGALSEEYNQQEQAEQLGYKIMAVQNVLRDPMADDALEVILSLGRDSRYYVLTRGWLGEQLRGDLSIQAAAKQQTAALIEQRITLLKSAIRAIDLE